MTVFLSCPSIELGESVDQVWDKFSTPIVNAIQFFVPMKAVHTRPLKKSKYWPRHIRRALNKKRSLWRSYRNNASLLTKCKYKEQAAYVRKLIHDHNMQIELSVINRANLGTFYRFVNGKLSCKSGVGPLKSPSGDMIVDDVSKAEMLSNYFASVFTVDDGNLPEFNRRVDDDVYIDQIIFSAADIAKTITGLKCTRTTDPHGFNSLFLKRLKFLLAGPMCSVFTYIFSVGVIPSAWRESNVTPVFKKGISSDVSNYRPISLTSLFSKIFERIVKQQMLTYLLNHKLITTQQFGFLSKCSTCTQLLDCLNDWTLSIRNRHDTDIIYFDFAKAFDSVSHAKLVHKLQAYGITGRLLKLLSDFLSNRFQRVVLPNGVSTYRAVTSGVPQGSVLGPVLFLIFINDIVDVFADSNVYIKLFADDVKLYLEIESNSDHNELQDAINKIYDWSITWQLRLASDKCQHCHISLSRISQPSDYFVSDFKLPIVSIARDLGVLIDSRLTFRDHIKSVVSRGHLRAMQIWRCFLCKDTDILIKAFTTYVRPLLEYCSPVWSPTSVGLVNDLESVQRRFTKRLPGFKLISYDDRCARLGIDRLELRRLRADLILCYKILHGLVLLSSDDFFTIVCNRATRGHSYKLFLPESRVDCRKRFFAVRIVRVWNSLPDDVVSADSLPLFVGRLRSVDLGGFIVGRS